MVNAAQPYGEPAPTWPRPAQRRAMAGPVAGLWSCGPPASHRTKMHRSPITPATKANCSLWPMGRPRHPPRPISRGAAAYPPVSPQPATYKYIYLIYLLSPYVVLWRSIFA